MISGNYIAGFVDGEGCFCITMSKHRTKKFGYDPRLLFEIELRWDDRDILEKIKERLDCGNIYDLNYERYGWEPHVKYAVHNIKDMGEKVIPFFRRYPLLGKKRKSFEIFCKAYEVFVKKQNLTLEGISYLNELKKEMKQFSSRVSVRQGAGKPRARWGEKLNNSDVSIYLGTPPVKSTKLVVPEVDSLNRKERGT